MITAVKVLWYKPLEGQFSIQDKNASFNRFVKIFQIRDCKTFFNHSTFCQQSQGFFQKVKHLAHVLYIKLLFTYLGFKCFDETSHLSLENCGRIHITLFSL